jgi:hypothetical protein
LLRDTFDRLRSPGLHFEYKRTPENQRQPEPVRQNNVMEEFAEFLVRRRRLVSPDASQQGSIRISFVMDQVAKEVQHNQRAGPLLGERSGWHTG